MGMPIAGFFMASFMRYRWWYPVTACPGGAFCANGNLLDRIEVAG